MIVANALISTSVPMVNVRSLVRSRYFIFARFQHATMDSHTMAITADVVRATSLAATAITAATVINIRMPSMLLKTDMARAFSM